jgi:sec-independent protein translocase protein TatB
MGAPLHIEVASLGMADTLILMVLALVVFGPRRLPQIGRQIGKLMYEFRKASNDFKFQMEEELRLSEEADRRKKEEEERKRLAALATPILPPAEADSPTPAPSIEAQADIGAIEASTAPPSAGEATPVEGFSAEIVERVAEPVITIPRLQPPQTGEQVPAGRPGAVAEEAKLEPDASARNGELSETDVDSPTPPKEPVSQHG